MARAVGRPPTARDSVSTAVRIPPELLERLDAEANRRDIGRGRLLARLLEEYLSDFEGQEI